MSEIPRGIVVIDETLERHEDIGTPPSAHLMGEMALSGTMGETEPEYDMDMVNQALGTRALREPTRHREVKPALKRFNLDLNVGSAHINKRVTVGTLGRHYLLSY